MLGAFFLLIKNETLPVVSANGRKAFLGNEINKG